MAISVFEIFKVGLGPSSSHTIGPMKAASLFLVALKASTGLEEIDRIAVEFYGSLALTGIGHSTDKAVILGLEGYHADTVDPALVESRPIQVKKENQLKLAGRFLIDFVPKKHFLFLKRKSLPDHPNGMIFRAFKGSSEVLAKTYYSIGGGFVVDDESAKADRLIQDVTPLPLPFSNGAELIALADSSSMNISQIMFRNEISWRSAEDIRSELARIWDVMNGCIDRGLTKDGLLPGGLKVKRRAKAMYARLSSNAEHALKDPLTILDWVNLYALAVNEENAAGSRVVTAPTNGAAGVIPAVVRYYLTFCGGNARGVGDFLLTAAAIGILYAQNASISGAEVGCQGEVGVACSMAAAGLTAVAGGSVRQVEQAAEIGMEHNLGLTCDPIGGLVQIPCIERNAMGAIKAINASRIALGGSGQHHVSLDDVIKTMRQTGKDMKDKYKETSRGGLAVNVTEC